MRRPVVAATAAAVVAMSAGAAFAWPADDGSDYTAEGRVWKEIVYEQFALDLTTSEANCLAVEVGSVEYTVGPLLGERPDDGTPGSVWRAVDVCLDEMTQDGLARAMALGGWSFEEPALAGVWETAGEQLGGCVQGAGGWQAVGSFEKFLVVCQPVIDALTGRNGA